MVSIIYLYYLLALLLLPGPGQEAKAEETTTGMGIEILSDFEKVKIPPKIVIERRHSDGMKNSTGYIRTEVKTALYRPSSRNLPGLVSDLMNEPFLYDGLNELQILEAKNFECYYVTCTAPYLVKWVTNIPMKGARDAANDVGQGNCGDYKYMNSRRLHDDPLAQNLSENPYLRPLYTIKLSFFVYHSNMGLLKCVSIETPALSTHIYVTDGTIYKTADPLPRPTSELVNYDPSGSRTSLQFKLREIFWENTLEPGKSGKLIIPCRATRLDVALDLWLEEVIPPNAVAYKNDMAQIVQDNGIIKLWGLNRTSESGSKLNLEYDPVIGFTLQAIDLVSLFKSPPSYLKFKCMAQDGSQLFHHAFLYNNEKQTKKITVVEKEADLASLSKVPNGCYLIRNANKFIYINNKARPIVNYEHYSLKFLHCNTPTDCDIIRQCLVRLNAVNIGIVHRLDRPRSRGLLRCFDYTGEIGLKPIYEYTFVGLNRIRYVLSEDFPKNAIIEIDEPPATLYTNAESSFRCHIADFVLVANIRFAVVYFNGTISLQNNSHKGLLFTSIAELEMEADLYDTNDLSGTINSNTDLGTGWEDISLNLTAQVVGIMCFAPWHNSTQWVNVSRDLLVKDVEKPQIVKKSGSAGNTLRSYYAGDSVSLHCKAHGAPEPNITWRLPNNEQTINSSLHQRLTEISTHDGNSVLQFPPMQKNYAGTYTCFAQNVAGFDQHEFVLKFEESGLGWDIIAAITAATIILIGSVLGFVIFWLKFRFAQQQLRDLTDEEVNQFTKGNGKHNENSHLNSDGQINLDLLPFRKELILDPSLLMIEKGAVLGQGQFGIVHRGLLNGVPVAVKTTKSTADVEYVKAFLMELKVMGYVGQHEHILLFLGAIIHKIRERIVEAVVELSPHGNLYDHLKKFRANSLHSEEEDSFQFINLLVSDEIVLQSLDTYNDSEGQNKTKTNRMSNKRKPRTIITTLEIIDWCRQIAAGMNYIASKSVYHGDLAARNVLVFNNNVVKISDFGLSKQLYSSASYVKKQKMPLPWRWMALESLRFMEFSIQSDVWAFGVTMWEILSLGETPYPGLTWTNEFVNILSTGMRMTKPQYCPKDVFDQMQICWSSNPEERPSFAFLVDVFENMLKPFKCTLSQQEKKDGTTKEAKFPLKRRTSKKQNAYANNIVYTDLDTPL